MNGRLMNGMVPSQETCEWVDADLVVLWVESELVI